MIFAGAREAMLLFLLVHTCIFDLVRSIPIEDINETCLRVTDVNSISNPIQPSVNYSNGTIFLGVITNVRGIVMGSDSDNNLVHGWYAEYLTAKAAVAAFLNGSIITEGAPTTIYPINYHILFGDEGLYNPVQPELTSAAYCVGVAHRMCRGSDLAGQTIPPVRTIIGAYSYTTEVAMLASAYGIPVVGFYASAAELGDNKDNYPWFMRTMQTTIYTVNALFAQHLGYTRADEIGCAFQGHQEVSAELARIYKGYGISLFHVTFGLGDHTGWPPGFPPAVKPNLAIHTDLALKAKWDFNVQLLKENNAHLHLAYLGGECPVFDILSYIGLNGLIGKGHLWLTSDYYSIFDTQYIAVLRVIGPSAHGMVSPYAFVKLFDGASAVRVKATAEKSKFFAWLKWLDDNGYRETIVPETYLQTYLTSSVFQSASDQQWRGGITAPYYLFDSIYTTLLGINNLLLTIGTNFTNAQLLTEMKNVTFGGLTGKVAFDKESGNRIVAQELIQYRVVSHGNHTYTNIPFGHRLLTTEDNYKELKEELSRRLAEERRMGTCAIPGSSSPADLATYLACITSVCEDAEPSVVSSMSGGAVPNCPAAHSFVTGQPGGSCDLDLKTIITTLPTGTYLWKVCPGTCKSRCADQRCYPPDVATCTPAGASMAALASYFPCLATYKMDALSSILDTMTGGSIKSCSALHAFVSGQGNDCTFDLNTLLASLPSPTPLSAICPASCIANSPACTVPSLPPSTGALIDYITCLEGDCLNADDSMVAALTSNSIANCAAAYAVAKSSAGCMLDLNSLLASLPVGTYLWKLCGAECKSTCEVEKNKCAVPDLTDPAAVATYFTCIEGKCADADDTVVSGLSSNNVPSCSAAISLVSSQPGGSCNTDLSTMLSAFPPGFYLWKLCGAGCSTECSASKATSSCAVPSSPTPTLLVPYFNCLQSTCDDSAPSLIKTLTGDLLSDCTAAYNYVLSVDNTPCKLELNSLSAGFPPGIQLWHVCGAVCYSECAAHSAANRTLDFYMQCRKKYCADTSPIVIHNLTGGNVADCPALKTIVSDDCTYDVALKMPRLGEKTPLWSMCSESCNCIDGSGPAPPPPPPSCPKDPSACDFYSTENVVVIGEYVHNLQLTATPLYYDETPNPAPDLDLSCVGGQRYNIQDGSCENCPPGKFTNKLGQTACTKCPMGTFLASYGSANCTACPWGTFSDMRGRSTACTNCTAGKYTGEPLQSECRKCIAGEFAVARSFSCTFCPAGTYQDLLEQSECKACADLVPGSTSAKASKNSSNCVCPAKQYWRPSIGCATCVEGLLCNGGNDVPTQIKGYQAFVFDAPTRGYEVYECALPEWCPEGLPGTCDEFREGAACARLSGKGCPWYFVIGIPMVGLLGAFVIYKVTSHSQYGTVTQVMILSGNISIALVAMQAVNVYMSFFVTMPEELQWIAAISQFFMLQINMVVPQCNIGQSFLARYSMGIMPPLAIIFVFLFLFVVTGILGKAFRFVLPFSLDATINVIGMILQVLYVMQCKDAFGFFNTVLNPSGQESLKDFTDVILWSDVHITPSTIMVTCYLFTFYVIGTYSVFVWVVVNAKKKVKEKRFVQRFRFVLSRWRPECWHWGLWMLGRNFCIAVTPIVARTHISFQALLYVVFLMGHALAEARYLPWAALINTYFEIIISTLLSLMAAGGLIFDNIKTSTPEEQAMGFLMALMFSCIWAIVLLAILWTIRWGTTAERTRRRENRFQIGCDLIAGCAQTAEKLEKGNPGVQRAWKRFIEHSGDYDQIVLSAAYTYLTRFESADPLRRTSFFSQITSYSNGIMTFNNSETSEKGAEREAEEEAFDAQVEMIKRNSSLSSHASNSVLEELGLERHGILKKAGTSEHHRNKDDGDIEKIVFASENSDETVNL